MDSDKHGSQEGPARQSGRFLDFVRRHRGAGVLLAALLGAGLAAWLVMTVVQQASRVRVAGVLSSLQKEGEKWRKDRAEQSKRKQQAEAEALLEPPTPSAEAGTEAGTQVIVAPSTPAPIEQAEKSEAAAAAEPDQSFAAYLQKLLEQSSDKVVVVEALWWQAQLREQLQDYSGTQESLAKIYRDHPRQPSARSAQMRSAYLYYEQNQVDEAVEQWDLLRAGEDGLALAATLQLGLVRSKRDEYDQARELLERFLNQSAGVKDTEGWQDLARSYLIALEVRAAEAKAAADVAPIELPATADAAAEDGEKK